MKKMLMAMVMMVFVLMGCSNTGLTVDEIKESGQLVVGMSADYPPFEFIKMVDGTDEIVGFDVMLAEEIAKQFGVALEIKEMKFDGLVGALQAGHIDFAVSGMSPTEERRQAVEFSELYYTGEQAILISEAAASTYQSTEDLKDATIGVQLGSIQSPLAHELSSNVKELAKTQDLVLELSNGNVDAVIVGAEIANRYAEEFDGVMVSSMTLEAAEGMAVAAPKGSVELMEEVSAIINELKESGQLADMFEEAMQLMNE